MLELYAFEFSKSTYLKNELPETFFFFLQINVTCLASKIHIRMSIDVDWATELHWNNTDSTIDTSVIYTKPIQYQQ